MVSENRKGSCGTMAICRRSTGNGRSSTSMPSMRTVPRGGLNNRGSRARSVDFPEPVGPMTPSTRPGSTQADTPCSTGLPL